jgi:hypothetical protein
MQGDMELREGKRGGKNGGEDTAGKAAEVE